MIFCVCVSLCAKNIIAYGIVALGLGMDGMNGMSVDNPTYVHLEDMTSAAYVEPNM